jgi:hypothetical protein
MRIAAPRERVVGDRRRIEADVAFEDVDRPGVTVYFEAGGPLADALEPLPEAFVLAAVPAAVWEGERRLEIDGALDRTLVSGLGQAMALLHHWYPRCRPLTLEPTRGTRTLTPAAVPHAAALCSGGVDALAMLQENLEALPRDHPRSIRTLVHLFGSTTYDFVAGEPSAAHVRASERTAVRLADLARQLGLEFTRFETNASTLYPDALSYVDTGHSATMLAPLVAVGRRVTDALTASSGAGVQPWANGSHPLLTPMLSTSAVRVVLAEPLVSRHAKVGRLADWEPAYDVVSPCHDYLDLPENRVNCGTCEKCVRTMTSLLAWGALARFTAFPADDVTPGMIEAVAMRDRLTYMDSAEVLDHLEAVGRADLAEAIRDKVRRRTESRWQRRRRKWRRSLAKRLGRGRSRP